MQKITLLGNLGKDAEERVIPSGRKLVSFSLAVSPRKNQTVWYECQVWGKRIELFEPLMPFLTKGSRILVFGDFHIPAVYEKKDGSTGIHLRMEPHSITLVGSGEKKEKQEFSLFADQQQVDEIPF